MSAMDWALWDASIFVFASLFAVLIVRLRWRNFPVFTVFLCFDIIWNIVLFFVFRGDNHLWYTRIYWWGDFFEFCLQLAVLWEIAQIIMRPTGTWVRDARKLIILWCSIGVLVATVLPWLVTPPSENMLDRLEVRGNLFTSLVICQLIAVVTRVSRSLGLGWRNHVMALVNGWTVWALCSILIDGLHCYFGAGLYFTNLERIRAIVFLLLFVYWIVQFWRDEPPRKPLSPELQAHILALHERIKKDLDIVKAQR